jgi:hypothetical protein
LQYTDYLHPRNANRYKKDGGDQLPDRSPMFVIHVECAKRKVRDSPAAMNPITSTSDKSLQLATRIAGYAHIVYSAPGKQVVQTVNEQQQAGEHDAVFIGIGVASGVGGTCTNWSLVILFRRRNLFFLRQPASLENHQGSGQK